MGFVNLSKIKDQVTITSINDHVGIQLDDVLSIVDKNTFHVIVASGCSTSASPYKEDFICLHRLPKPVKLNGIAGNSSVTCGDTMQYQCIDAQGEIVKGENI